MNEKQHNAFPQGRWTSRPAFDAKPISPLPDRSEPGAEYQAASCASVGSVDAASTQCGPNIAANYASGSAAPSERGEISDTERGALLRANISLSREVERLRALIPKAPEGFRTWAIERRIDVDDYGAYGLHDVHNGDITFSTPFATDAVWLRDKLNDVKATT